MHFRLNWIDGYVTKTGIFCEEFDLNFQLVIGKYAMVYQSELYVILVATYVLTDWDIMGRIIRFFSDIRLPFVALREFDFTSRLVYECFLCLERALETLFRSSGPRVHTGLPVIEKADSIQKIGVQKILEGPDPVVGLSLKAANTLKNSAHKTFCNMDNTKWLSKTAALIFTDVFFSEMVTLTNVNNDVMVLVFVYWNTIYY